MWMTKLSQICKNDYSWNPSACFCNKSKYFKSIADISVIACDNIISDMDIVLYKYCWRQVLLEQTEQEIVIVEK